MAGFRHLPADVVRLQVRRFLRRVHVGLPHRDWLTRVAEGASVHSVAKWSGTPWKRVNRAVVHALKTMRQRDGGASWADGDPGERIEVRRCGFCYNPLPAIAPIHQLYCAGRCRRLNALAYSRGYCAERRDQLAQGGRA